MRKEKSQGSISSGRARVLVLGFFLSLFSFVIKELKLLQGCRRMDNPIPALHTATHRTVQFKSCVLGRL